MTIKLILNPDHTVGWVDEPIINPVPDVPIPLLTRWELNGEAFGRRLAAKLTDPKATQDQKLGNCYYDAAACFFELSEYWHEDDFGEWAIAGEDAISIYRDGYVYPNGGNMPAYWNFTDGLRMTALNSQKSRDAIKLLRDKGAFVRDPVANYDFLRSSEYSREVAYVMRCLINYQKVFSGPIDPRLKQYLSLALEHVQQWFVDNTAPYMRPFMVGLTARSLIETPENVFPLADKINAVKMLAAGIKPFWSTASKAFQYTDRIISNPDDVKPAPDLNLLIAPMYAWLWKETKGEFYREFGDMIFEGGVSSAYLDSGKQFCQNYCWSFRYVEWRR